MAITCLVFDFDGTFTDIDAEAESFVHGYRDDVAKQCNWPRAQFDRAWADAEAEIRATPDLHGWRWNGVIMASGHTDPYIMPTCVANLIFDAHGILSEPRARLSAIQDIFKRNYAHAGTHFRPDAGAVLDQILERNTPTFIVTNSQTAAVERKLGFLNLKHRDRIRVLGDARKFVHTPDPTPHGDLALLPPTLNIPGLSRPVQLHRGHYFDVFRTLWQITGATASTTMVVGDNFELDLALPLQLGASVHLVTRSSTPDYEKNAVAAAARGAVGTNLASVLSRL